MNKLIAYIKVYSAVARSFPEMLRESSLLSEIKEKQLEDKCIRHFLLEMIREEAALKVAKRRLSSDFYDKVFSPSGVNLDFVYTCTVNDIIVENLKRQLGFTDEEMEAIVREVRAKE